MDLNKLGDKVHKEVFCHECGISNNIKKVKRRLCTGTPPLCAACRSSPQYKIMSETTVRRVAPLLEREYYPPAAGYIVNCKHPAFKSQRVYFWSDIAIVCDELGIEMLE